MLTAGRKIQERPDKQYAWPLAAGQTPKQGSLMALSAGSLVRAGQQANAAAAAAMLVVGILEKLPPYDPNATAPALYPVRKGTFLFLNSAGADAITLSNVGQPAYAVDDETVALTSNNSLRPSAGTIVDVESDGVWVRVHP